MCLADLWREKVALDRITVRLRGDKFGGKAMDPKNIGKAILGRFGDDQDIDYIMRSLSRTPALEADVKSVLFSEVQKRWQRASITLL